MKNLLQRMAEGCWNAKCRRLGINFFARGCQWPSSTTTFVEGFLAGRQDSYVNEGDERKRIFLSTALSHTEGSVNSTSLQYKQGVHERGEKPLWFCEFGTTPKVRPNTIIFTHICHSLAGHRSTAFHRFGVSETISPISKHFEGHGGLKQAKAK